MLVTVCMGCVCEVWQGEGWGVGVGGGEGDWVVGAGLLRMVRLALCAGDLLGMLVALSSLCVGLDCGHCLCTVALVLPVAMVVAAAPCGCRGHG